MNELDNFLKKINEITKNYSGEDKDRKIIKLINDFLFTSHKDIGTTNILNDNFNYFSDFHKYWEKHYKQILNVTIDELQCEKVANVLHEIYLRTKGNIFHNVWDTESLDNATVCKIRLLTANQDFRGSRKFKDLADCFKKNPSIFDIESIYNDPENFIKNIGITDLSQSDKRISYAKNISDFVKKLECEPIDIIKKYSNDAILFKKDLTDENKVKAGYGNKKADMFIRDMVVLKIWTNVKNFDKINVASDINTIKIALRTGILKTEIPLVSSFLDIFDNQYSYMDEMSALAWRKVWEIWRKAYPDESIESPCLLDYLIYMIIGKEICGEKLNKYTCDKNDIFYDFSSKKRKCPKCGSTSLDKQKIMTCESEEGNIVLEETDLGKSSKCTIEYKNCPFKAICDEYNHKKLSAPKSISIKGKTGWESAYSDSEKGGGGLMS